MSTLLAERPSVETRAPIEAQEETRPLIAAVERFLERERQHPAKLIGPDGDEIELPGPLYEALRRAAHLLAQDEAVVIAPLHKQLTTNEAADFLGISRQYLYHLLDRDEIPFTMVGTHRRIRLDDLVAYKERRAAKRRRALDRLAQISEEIGLYDRE